MCAPHNAHVHQTKLEEEDKKIKRGDVQQKNNEKKSAHHTMHMCIKEN